MSGFEKKNNYSISSLRDLAMREVNEIPHSLLQVVCAKTVLCKEKGSWYQWTTVHMKAYIPIVKDEVDLFYFLEYSEAHSQLEPRMTDYTHMLTNLRSLVCHKGLVNVKRSAFVCIAEEHPGVLSKAIVIANLDKQSVVIAQKLFSVQIENLLERNGDHHEVFFVHLVRNWYLACDQRGMSANDRVNNLWAFYVYLCHNVDFNSFPCPGSYTKGIPAVTFCSILQNILIRLSLYHISKKHTYNARSILSLVCESFFFNFECNGNQSGKSQSNKYTNMIGNLMTTENYKQSTTR